MGGIWATNRDKGRCASCDIELTRGSLLVQGAPFCCSGCAQGGPCICTYEGRPVRRPRDGYRALLLVLEKLENRL